MKRLIIITLVCINLGLLAALVGLNMPRAHAQFRGGTDYLVVTGQVESGNDAVYVMDLAKRKLAMWKFDKTRKRLVPHGPGRLLTRDFARK